MPETDFTLEIEHADNRFALGVVTGHSERTAVVHHCIAFDGDAHHAALFIGRILNIRVAVLVDARIVDIEIFWRFW